MEDAFSLRRQEGSYKRYTHHDGRRVTVTAHKDSDTFAIKTLKSMIEIQACWNEYDLKRLKLLS